MGNAVHLLKQKSGLGDGMKQGPWSTCKGMPIQLWEAFAIRLRRPELLNVDTTCRLFEEDLENVCFGRLVGQRVVWA